MEKDSLTPGKRKEKKVLLVPAVSNEHGTGHLKRSIFLLDRLGEHTYLYIPQDIAKTGSLQKLLQSKKNIIHKLDRNEQWDIVVLDKKATIQKEFRQFFLSGIVIGLDEGGVYRQYFPYLVDTVLNPLQKIKPNKFASLYQYYMTTEKEYNRVIKKVLLSFGGEDYHHLSFTLVQALLDEHIFPPAELTIVQGPLFKHYNWPVGVEIIKNPADVADLLPDYDLVFTHFGMTCFESLAKGVPVILFNPTSYHQKLGNFYRIPSIGIIKPRIGKLKRYLTHPDIIKASLYTINLFGDNHSYLPDLLQSMTLSGNTHCPVCRKIQNKVIQRLPNRTFFVCTACHIIYYQGFKNNQETYDRNYFFHEYKKQYGRTYIEDFNTIKHYARDRCAILKKIIGEKKSLLDVGCAYGPFLASAKEEGFIPDGMDISSDASTYVNTMLNIQCQCMDFTKITDEITGNKKYDVITMWFVLEHFSKTDIVLKKVNRYLKIGGVFAFSTPNVSGISYKKNKKLYLENNPKDHYTLWNPAAVRKVLQLYGFKVIKIRITGHHPERFPMMKDKGVKGDKKKEDLLFSFFFLISKIFHLGDTFEVYAQKVEHVP